MTISSPPRPWYMRAGPVWFGLPLGIVLEFGHLVDRHGLSGATFARASTWIEIAVVLGIGVLTGYLFSATMGLAGLDLDAAWDRLLGRRPNQRL